MGRKDYEKHLEGEFFTRQHEMLQMKDIQRSLESVVSGRVYNPPRPSSLVSLYTSSEEDNVNVPCDLAERDILEEPMDTDFNLGDGIVGELSAPILGGSTPRREDTSVDIAQPVEEDPVVGHLPRDNARPTGSFCSLNCLGYTICFLWGVLVYFIHFNT